MSGDLRDLIDQVVWAPKELQGVGEFKPHDRSQNEYRYGRNLISGAQDCGRLEIIYHPEQGNPIFTIHILYHDRSIWRLDWKDQNHTNLGLNTTDIPKFIRGPHYHQWRDNRHLARADRMSNTFSIARPLPENITSFNQALKWFYDNTNIRFNESDIPVTPSGGFGF